MGFTYKQIFFQMCGLFLLVFVLMGQLISLTTTSWGIFSARTDLGKPKEDGHYGIWRLCSTKGPHWIEECNPLYSFFLFPPFMEEAGVLSIICTVITLTLIPLESMCILHESGIQKSFSPSQKVLDVARFLISFITVILAVLVAVFASLGEKSQTEYIVKKGWSFWLQVTVIVMNMLMMLYFAIKAKRVHSNNPEDIEAETYGNPVFDADSPEHGHNCECNRNLVAYTTSSGFPLGVPLQTLPETKVPEIINKVINSQNQNTLSYGNEFYMESSPTVIRAFKNSRV